MRFWTLGLAVALATHVVASSVACLLVAWWHRMWHSRLAPLAPGVRARCLLTLALFPSAAGLVAAGLAALAWLVFEPRSTAESPGPVLLALALLGVAVVILRSRLGRTGCGPHPAGRRPLPPQRPRDGRSAASGLACRPSLPGGGPRGRVAAAIAAVGAGARSTEPGGAGRSPGARARASRRAGQPEAPAAGRVPRCSRPDERGPPPALGVPRGRGGGRRRPCLRTGLSHRARARDPQGRPARPRGGPARSRGRELPPRGQPRLACARPGRGIAASVPRDGTRHGASSRALWWSGSPWPSLSRRRSPARTPCSPRCTAHSSASCTCSPRRGAEAAERTAVLRSSAAHEHRLLDHGFGRGLRPQAGPGPARPRRHLASRRSADPRGARLAGARRAGLPAVRALHDGRLRQDRALHPARRGGQPEARHRVPLPHPPPRPVVLLLRGRADLPAARRHDQGHGRGRARWNLAFLVALLRGASRLAPGSGPVRGRRAAVRVPAGARRRLAALVLEPAPRDAAVRRGAHRVRAARHGRGPRAPRARALGRASCCRATWSGRRRSSSRAPRACCCACGPPRAAGSASRHAARDSAAQARSPPRR